MTEQPIPPATLKATELVINASRHYEGADSFGGFLEQLQKSMTLLENLNDTRDIKHEDADRCRECGRAEQGHGWTQADYAASVGVASSNSTLMIDHPFQSPVHPIDRMLGKALTKLSGQAFRYVERAVERGWIGGESE